MYPRKDAPLAPEVLASFLGDRLVSRSTARRYGLPEDLRLRDLDAGVWERFPPESIRPLASEVVVATRELFPEIAASGELAPIDPSGNGLSLRAGNALFRAGLLGTPWLSKVPLGKLAQEPGAGPKTLLEWLVAGDVLQESAGHGTSEVADASRERRTRSRAVHKAADAIRRRRWSERIRTSDLRLGHRLETLRGGVATAREAAERLETDLFAAAAARTKARQLREFLAEAERLRRVELEDELDQILRGALGANSRSGNAVKLRLGLGGEPPLTLSKAGERVGLTRERVRQVERSFVDAVRKSGAWTPVLEKVLKVTAEAGPMTAVDAQSLLLDKGLVRGSFSIESILSAAQVFELEPGFDFDRDANVIYRSGSSASLRLVTSEARRLTTHWGAATVDALRAELGDRGADEIEPALLRILLGAVPNLEWLDEEKEWFWVKGTSRNRLLNQAEKIIAVAGSIGIAELREGVGRFYRMDGFRPPREVLAQLCVQAELCRREGDLMIETPSVRPWEEVLGSTIERRIAEILFEHGPVMRRDDLEDIAVNERGLNRSSFYVYLGYSPIIARYAPGVYGLRGARVSAGEVNALIPPRAKTQRLVDHGWTSDGRVWIAYKMSEAALTAGVLSVPAALQEFVAGSYLLFSEQERPVGTLVIKGSHMWGVSPFYRRWGVEEGDFVVVTIDINASRATILSGGEEMLLRFQEGD